MSPAGADAGKAIARVLARHGRVDLLVNKAGITAPDRLMDVTDALHDRVMDVNMRGCFHLTHTVVPAKRAAGSGSIVNMSSAAGQRGGGVFSGTPSAAARAAILGYTKACAHELGVDNSRVNAVCPSLIDTDMTAGAISPSAAARSWQPCRWRGSAQRQKWPAAACSWHQACLAMSQGSKSDVNRRSTSTEAFDRTAGQSPGSGG
jgi:NAD(P)-dependent dehydrogenase (short-subunit alcohol dehydrogenase family)